MAYVASWIAPSGVYHGAQNIQQAPRNRDNLHIKLEVLESNAAAAATESDPKQPKGSYNKPPFCQWPQGGSTRREAKHRAIHGKPIVKAQSSEECGDEFYFRRLEKKEVGEGMREWKAGGTVVGNDKNNDISQQVRRTRTFNVNQVPIKVELNDYYSTRAANCAKNFQTLNGGSLDNLVNTNSDEKRAMQRSKSEGHNLKKNFNQKFDLRPTPGNQNDISHRTASTTLGMATNLCTRTFGARQGNGPRRLPFMAQPQRPRFEKKSSRNQLNQKSLSQSVDQIDSESDKNHPHQPQPVLGKFYENRFVNLDGSRVFNEKNQKIQKQQGQKQFPTLLNEKLPKKDYEIAPTIKDSELDQNQYTTVTEQTQIDRFKQHLNPDQLAFHLINSSNEMACERQRKSHYYKAVEKPTVKTDVIEQIRNWGKDHDNMNINRDQYGSNLEVENNSKKNTNSRRQRLRNAGLEHILSDVRRAQSIKSNSTSPIKHKPASSYIESEEFAWRTRSKLRERMGMVLPNVKKSEPIVPAESGSNRNSNSNSFLSHLRKKINGKGQLGSWSKISKVEEELRNNNNSLLSNQNRLDDIIEEDENLNHNHNHNDHEILDEQDSDADRSDIEDEVDLRFNLNINENYEEDGETYYEPNDRVLFFD